MLQGLRRTFAIVLVALLATGFLVGCNLAPPLEEESAEETPEVPVEKVTTIEAPTGWPKDVPLYPGAEIVSTTLTATEQGLVLKTEDTAAEIFNWYYDQLGVRHWEMHRPRLDVARNDASINGSLEGRKLFLKAGTSETEEGYTSLSITADPPLNIK